jgi:hypothetical protein
MGTRFSAAQEPAYQAAHFLGVVVPAQMASAVNDVQLTARQIGHETFPRVDGDVWVCGAEHCKGWLLNRLEFAIVECHSRSHAAAAGDGTEHVALVQHRVGLSFERHPPGDIRIHPSAIDACVVAQPAQDLLHSLRSLWNTNNESAHRRCEVCAFDPGYVDDLVVTITDTVVFARWHLGLIEWTAALRSGGLDVTGVPELRRALPTWNGAPAVFAGRRAGIGLPARAALAQIDVTA